MIPGGRKGRNSSARLGGVGAVPEDLPLAVLTTALRRPSDHCQPGYPGYICAMYGLGAAYPGYICGM